MQMHLMPIRVRLENSFTFLSLAVMSETIPQTSIPFFSLMTCENSLTLETCDECENALEVTMSKDALPV